MEVTHKQFDLSGFLPDQAPDTLKSGAISRGYNIKPTILGWEKSGGFRETNTEPTNERDFIFFWSPAIGDNRWFSGGDTTVQQVEGNVVSNVSRDGGYTAGSGKRWNAVNFNGVLLMNNELDSPQYLSASGKLADFPNLPSNVRFRTVAVYKNFILGLGVNFGSGFLDDEIYWSHQADPGTMPPNWDYANAASDSGRTPLPSEGYCVTAEELGSMNIIYKSDSIWTMQLIGGQWIFRFENKFPGQGILNKKSVVSFEGKHFVVTQKDIIVHDGYQVRSAADKRVRNFFFSDMNSDYFERVFVVKDPRVAEISVFYPSKNSVDGSCDRALVWNWRDDVWSLLYLRPLKHAAYGYEITGVSITWDNFTGEWESTGLWQADEDVAKYAPVLHYSFKDTPKLLAPTPQALFINEEVEAVWEREDIVIGSISRDGVPYQDYGRNKSVSCISFDVDTTEPFDVYIGSKGSLEDSVEWEFAGTVNPMEDKRLFCLITAGLISMRIISKAQTFILRSYKVTYEFAGEMWS